MTTLRPDDYQDEDDPAADAARRHEEELAAGLLSALAAFRSALDVNGIIAALQTANLAGVMAQLPFLTLAARLDDASDALSSTYRDAAITESNVIHLPYDPTATAGTTDLDLYRKELLADIRQSTQDGITQAVRAAVRQHVSINDIAQAIRDTLGLTPRQAQAVANFRAALEAGDSSALGRALRDTRFDATIRRLVAGEDVPASKIDRMVERYAERQLAYRARTLAQTEAMKVANAGVRSTYERAVARGLFSSAAIRRHWLVALSEGTCPLCLSIPILNYGGVGMDQSFMSIGGPVMQPVTGHTSALRLLHSIRDCLNSHDGGSVIPPNSEIRCVYPVGSDNLRATLEKLSGEGFTIWKTDLAGAHNYTVVAFRAKAP